MKYVSQIITLCILNIYRAVYQLYLNKAGRKIRAFTSDFPQAIHYNLLQ